MMTNLISGAIACIKSLFSGFSARRIVSVILVGFLVLTTGMKSAQNETLPGKIKADLQQTGNERPKTTGEWEQEARKTEDAPGKRTERILKESGDALKDWGGVYPDTADRSGRDLKENTGTSDGGLFD